jgi:dolichyl-phosphate-mannose--protein O-mannosyl transferase
VWLRIQSLGFPAVFTWDEHHFVENARNYLAHRPDLNDHPPLGKLMIATALQALGDTSRAWRTVQLGFGLLLLPVVNWLGVWASGERRVGWIAAAMVALDGFFIAYSRAALLDGILVTLGVVAVWLACTASGATRALLAAAVAGSACAVKFSGIAFLAPVTLIVLSQRSWTRLLSLSAAPVAYFSWYSLGLWMAHKSFSPKHVVLDTLRLYKHHAALTDWVHPFLSHWYEWFLPTHPIVMRSDTTPEGLLRVMSSVGNPALWWFVDFAVVFVAIALCVAAWRWFHAKPVSDGPMLRRVAVLLLCFAAPIAPWIFSNRDSYINHYLPAYVFGVLLAATLIGKLFWKRATVSFVLLLNLMLVGAYYSPVWGQLPITRDAMQSRLFLQKWR